MNIWSIVFVQFQSDSHDISEVSTDSIQFVNIRVKPTRPGINEFIIRINALDFKTLQDRMLRPITILDGVQFNKTVIDRFIEVFKQQIRLNPLYHADEVNFPKHTFFLGNTIWKFLFFFRLPIYVLPVCKPNQTLNCKRTAKVNQSMEASTLTAAIATVDLCGVSIVWQNGLLHAKTKMKKMCGYNKSALAPCVDLHFVY